MTKKIKIILIVLFSILFFTLSGLYISRENFYNISPISNYKEDIKVKISGQVVFPGEKTFKKGTLLKEIIEKFKPLPNSDLSVFKLQEKQFEDLNLEIKKQKPLLSNNLKEEVFKKIKINKSLLAKIQDFFLKNKHREITWEDIEQIPGLGSKSLEKLQNNFSLE